MPQTDNKPAPNKGQILQEIDRKLPQLPEAQQNMVAAYARGLSDGLSLEANRKARGGAISRKRRRGSPMQEA